MSVDLGLGHWWFGELVLARQADAAALTPLTRLFTSYGLTADLIEWQRRPVLVVANDAGTVCGPWTTVYLADHLASTELAVYGFTSLYLGPLKHPERVAARLAWLLGVPDNQRRHLNPVQDGASHDA